MKKWLISIAFVLILTLCLLPGQAQAAEVVASGTYGDFTWTLDDGGTLTLSGSGVFDTGDLWYGSSDNPWLNHAESIKKLVVSEGVTGLYGEIIQTWSMVEEIALPSTLYYLGDGVLPRSECLQSISVGSRNPYFCTVDQVLYSKDMTTLYLFPAAKTGSYSVPQGVTTIGTSAFYLSKLSEVVLPDGLKFIGNKAFFGADITSINLPDGLTQIGNSAFEGCIGLTSIEVPGTVEHIGDYAFGFCKSLNSAILHEGVSYIGERAFYDCTNIQTISVPGSLKVISSYAFAFCDCLATVTLEEGVESISNGAFWGSGLKTIEIPASVVYIGSNAFDYSTLKSIWISPENPVYSNVGLALLSKDKTQLIRLMDWDAVSYTVPKTVTELHPESISSCLSLREIKLPNSLVRIGDEAFDCCYSLTHIEFPENLQYLGDNLFYYCHDLTTLFFRGNAPMPEGSPFGTYDPYRDDDDERLVATAYYPADDLSWTQEAMDALGGNITWVPYDNPFRDLSESSFCYVPVIWAVENGITNGLSATSFGPTASCNRAQVVTFLWRSVGSPEPRNTSHPFVDVKEGAYYYKAMLWAVENGITNGTDATHFSPDKPCDRATVVTFLWRSQNEPAPRIEESPFVDVREGRFYYEAVLWAMENGITSGTAPSIFSPTSICNRGQVVTFLYRAYC